MLRMLKILVVVLCLSLTASANAVIYTGSLAEFNGGIITNSTYWKNSYLEWIVDNETTPGFWTYNYKFSVCSNNCSKDLSHMIVETSSSFTEENVISVTGSEGYKGYEIGTYTEMKQGNSNPGLPESIYGIKFNYSTDGAEFWTATLITDRAPIWGDWYAKDGIDNNTKNFIYAYNAGFTLSDPTDPASNGSILNHLLVPDTNTQIPETQTIIMLMFGIVYLGMLKIRFN